MKCKYRKECKKFKEDSDICNYNQAKNYYGLGRHAGCYREMEKLK